jgi:hypothetical protein
MQEVVEQGAEPCSTNIGDRTIHYTTLEAELKSRPDGSNISASVV